jgi:deoxyadenosine/deoxycytidine kinase
MSSNSRESGKIIAIIGAQRTGKSYLCQKLSEAMRARFFLEGDGGVIPDWLQNDIQQGTNTLRRVLWFRNILVHNFKKAQELTKQGETILLDVLYTDVEAHAHILLRDHDLDVVMNTFQLDTAELGYPDRIIYLINNEERTKQFIREGGRAFDTSERYFTDYVVPVREAFENSVARFPPSVPVLRLDRSDLDFNLQSDLQVILDFIR